MTKRCKSLFLGYSRNTSWSDPPPSANCVSVKPGRSKKLHVAHGI
jgi:hypothetical protein